MKLKSSYLLSTIVLATSVGATPAHAQATPVHPTVTNTFFYDFEKLSGPNMFNFGVDPAKIISEPATFNGGVVLTKATFFPANSTGSSYGTAFDPAHSIVTKLPQTLTIDISTNFHASEVSFDLFNGEIFTQDFIVKAFGIGGVMSGDPTLVNNLKPNQPSTGSFSLVDLFFADPLNTGKYFDINQVTITFLPKPPDLTNPNNTSTHPATWDFLIDNVKIGGNPAIAATVPEPETYAMMMVGLGMMGFIARRRKTA